MQDPHRAAGCRWESRDTDPTRLGWFELLDWAVYHAPGWELWQEFRKSLVGQGYALRAHRIAEWWEEAQEVCASTEEEILTHELADAVRCVNVLRSLRGQFSENPRLPQLLVELNVELETRWQGRGKS